MKEDVPVEHILLKYFYSTILIVNSILHSVRHFP